MTEQQQQHEQQREQQQSDNLQQQRRRLGSINNRRRGGGGFLARHYYFTSDSHNYDDYDDDDCPPDDGGGWPHHHHLNIFQRDCVPLLTDDDDDDDSHQRNHYTRKRGKGGKGKGGKGYRASKSSRSKAKGGKGGYGYAIRLSDNEKGFNFHRPCPPGYIHKDTLLHVPVPRPGPKRPGLWDSHDGEASVTREPTPAPRAVTDRPSSMAPTTATPTVGASTLLPTTATTTATPTVATTTATPTVQPTIPVAMDNTNNPTIMVPTIAPSIETSGFPSSLFPSNFFSSSFFITTKATGDRAMGDCYFVDVQQICNFIKPPPCHSYIMMFTYYNGGFYRDPNNPESEDWIDSGESETIYEVVTVTGIVDCENEETTPDTCTIAVQNRGTCNECRYDRETKLYSLVDCSNLPGVIFEQGVEQSYQYYDDGALPPYEHQFFTLEFDQERCDEYALPEG